MSRRAVVLDWTIPVVLLALLTIPFFTTNIDMRIARHFYVHGQGFPIGAEPLWRWLKHEGAIPPIVVSFIALIAFIVSYFSAGVRPHRRAALFLVLAMALGPGLIVNDVFKDNWGRPRPRDVIELGGTRDYVPPLVMSPRGNGASFMSGHAATAFYLMTPYFLFRRRSRARAFAFFFGGLAYGALMGYARIAQGAHFLSDIVWSLGIVYLTALTLFYLIHPNDVPVGLPTDVLKRPA
jgi:membrane-associated PAP2 superfamily phosphatase